MFQTISAQQLITTHQTRLHAVFTHYSE